MKMLSRLDAKYCRPNNVTNSILNEIKKLKVENESIRDKRIIFMVDKI